MDSKYSSKRFIVSADDFGISAQANERILNLLAMGKIDRVSVLPLGVFNQYEIEKLSNSGVKLDLHLSIANDHEQRVNKGVLERSIKFILDHVFGRVDPSAVQITWTKQLEKFREVFGRNPDGVNSHEHVHFFPTYFKLIIALARDNGIGYMRFGSLGVLRGKSNVYRILHRLHRMNHHKFRESGLESSDYLVSLDWLNVDVFLQASTDLQNVEIVTHPEREAEFDIISKYF